jgi:ABC-type nitrate/sulfonate/bicarbonate transport system permease component
MGRSEKKKALIRSIIGLSAFFLLWEIIVRLGIVSERRMSTFTEVVRTFLGQADGR